MTEGHETETLPGFKESLNIRIEILYKNKKSRFPFGKEFAIAPVQGLPFKAYLKITNISNIICGGARIKSICFESKTCAIATTTDNEIQFGSLNPKESITLEVDAFTLKIDGPFWFSCDLEPLSTDQEIVAYQYDLGHQKDNAYVRVNSFGSTVFVEGKLASLQNRTNNYILMLTIITALEAIFGIKNIIQAMALGIAGFFSLLAKLFVFISSIG